MEIIEKLFNCINKQRGRVKLTLISLAAIIVTIIITVIATQIIIALGFIIRSSILTTIGYIVLILCIVFGFGLIACLQLYDKKFSCIIRIFGTLALIAAIGFGSLWGIFTLVWTSNEEVVVDRDGEMMLAVVDAFLDINVTYYDYKNWLCHGNTVRGIEWYGSGGYNPFDRNPAPIPITATYYDANGRCISFIGDDKGQRDSFYPS